MIADDTARAVEECDDVASGVPAGTVARDRRAHMRRRLAARARAMGLDPAIVAQISTPVIDAFLDLESRARREGR